MPSDIEFYRDKAMYPAAPMQQTEPTAHLLWMTPDPLGAVAAAVRMYKGKPTYSLSDITDDERRECWDAVQKTELQAPLEFVKLHVFWEGVDRSLTHQAVRQRTAVYAQESLRFAVKDGNLLEETSRPPSLDDPTRSQSERNDLEDAWTAALASIERNYKALIANGMPAEDARGLLPHAILTRYNYCTDLRNLSAEAGKRLCTQAQFHWRKAFMSLRKAVRNYGDPENWWQFDLIADSNLFAPVCYQIGKCGFKAEFDRGCTIRERVDWFEEHGVQSVMWDRHKERGIKREEWLSDPKAGWMQ
jgi:thymidylate synthase ThyX